MNLSDVLKGKIKIISFAGGMGMQSRLAGIGIIQGSEIEVARNEKKGPVVLRIKNSRIAIGRGVSEKIIVQLLQVETGVHG